nr:MAG: hypothetical protein [Bacteriophage sp.]
MKIIKSNNINNMDVNTIVDVIMRYTNDRITLSTDTYQELVAKASNQNREVDKKTLELMRKDLETINKLKEEVEYWKNLYKYLSEEKSKENSKKTKRSWF